MPLLRHHLKSMKAELDAELEILVQDIEACTFIAYPVKALLLREVIQAKETGVVLTMSTCQKEVRGFMKDLETQAALEAQRQLEIRRKRKGLA